MPIRDFQIVSKYVDQFGNNFKFPRRATKKSACYDVFNQTGAEIVLEPGEMSSAITTYVKAYMLDDEVLMAYVRSGHGFKYSVRLANSTGIIDCVTGDTIISTPYGDIPMKVIYDSDSRPINSLNEDAFKIENDTIKDMWIVNDLELKLVETDDGTRIKLPINKEVYTKRGWVKVADLTTNDEILSIK